MATKVIPRPFRALQRSSLRIPPVAAAAVAQGATDGGARAVAEAYHATLVAPFCFAAVKSFFANP